MKKYNRIMLVVLILLSLSVIWTTVFAAELYKNQEKIPGAEEETSCFPDYLKQIINFGFAVIGILAMFMIAFGAFQYLMSAGNLSKAESAKETIASAVGGLILGLCAWIILNTINPDLVNMDLECEEASSSVESPADTGTTTSEKTTEPTGSETPSKKTDAKCDTVKNYDGFLNKNLSDGLYNESKINSSQDLKNVLQNIRSTPNGLAQYSDQIYESCKSNNVPFWYAIGTFAKESNLFSEGNSGCSKYNNPGCMRAKGKYINYDTPEKGIKANIDNMGRLLKKGSTPMEAWIKWYDPDGSGNCPGAQEYLDLMKWSAGKTGLSGV